jgi:AAA domain
MIAGFQLRTLKVVGRNKQDAVVTFRPGLNVISGASNTGKSYILQCISFMLGSSKKPKRIDEARGYDTCLLELEDHNGQLHQLQRSLSGNAFSHKIIAGGNVMLEETLSEKNDPTNINTISGLLLNLTDAWGLKIRQTQAGKTRQVSYADFRRLTLIDEVRIISEGSPVLSGQHTTPGEETAFFKLLLTGVDDSSVIASESRAQSVARRRAQLELLDRLIPQIEKEIADMDAEPTTLTERLERIAGAIARQTAIVEQDQHELAVQEAAQHEAWTNVRRIENKQANTTGLRRRFEILEQHYRNDLNRLLAIDEVDSFFSQLQPVRCPVCGSDLDSDAAEPHIHPPNKQFADIQRACRAETAKIQLLMRDLVGTTQQLDAELVQLQETRSEQLSLFNEAARNLAKRLSPAAHASKSDLDQLLETRERLSNARVLQDRKNALVRERDLIAASTWQRLPTIPNSEVLVPQATESFSLKVEDLLRAWRYPGLTRVTFSDEGLDLLISGKERASEGKGFRAIAYAAYIIGLLDHCAETTSKLLHPGLVVLDSPLVTYKRRDTAPGEAIPDDVTTAFYEALAATSATKQIIVLENNDPPERLQSSFHYVHFSRSNVGRYGFFPLG